MTPPHQTRDQGSITPVVVAVVVTASFLLAILIFAWQPPSHNQEISLKWFSNPVLNVDEAEVVASRAKFNPTQYLRGIPQETQKTRQSELLQAYQAANLFSFKPAKDPTAHVKEGEMIEKRLAARSDEALEILKDFNQYVHLGDPLFSSCLKALDQISEKLRSQTWTIQNNNLSDKDLESKESAEYREMCGNALPLLLQHGLMTPKQGWKGAKERLIFGALQRRRFLDPVISRINVADGLSPADRYLIAWWRTMMPDAFSQAERRHGLATIQILIPEKQPTTTYTGDGAAPSPDTTTHHPTPDPLTNPNSPFYFNQRQAAVSVEGGGKKTVEKVYKDVCKSKNGVKIDQKVCNWLNLR